MLVSVSVGPNFWSGLLQDEVAGYGGREAGSAARPRGHRGRRFDSRPEHHKRLHWRRYGSVQDREHAIRLADTDSWPIHQVHHHEHAQRPDSHLQLLLKCCAQAEPAAKGGHLGLYPIWILGFPLDVLHCRLHLESSGRWDLLGSARWLL